MNWHRLDPALPLLPQVFDPQAIMDQFTQQAGDDASSESITQCQRHSVEYVPATRCTTTYLLGNEDAAWHTIGVAEVTAAGIEHRFYTEDPRLAGLKAALNVATLTARYGKNQSDMQEIEAVVPVRYKPGSRCTLRYDVQGQTHCFGKLLAQDGKEIAQAVEDLFQASQTVPELPGIAQPLAYWPDLQLLVQVAISGEELHEIAFDEAVKLSTRVHWMHAAGRATAALHNANVEVAGPNQTLLGDLNALGAYRPALGQLNPRLASGFGAAVEAVRKAAQRQEEVASVLSHGALRTDQFMLEEDHLVLIDLDSLCQSSPARDLGNFLAYLAWKALRQPQHAAFIQLGQQAFLEGYETLREMPESRSLTLYQVASVLKIIGRRYTGLTHREWPLTEQLLEIAIRMVA